MEKLRQYYVGLKVNPVGPKDLHPCHFPSICAYRDENNLNKVVQFKYVEPLEVDSTCATFLATPTTDTQKLVVIKFVQRYGEEAHRLLAKESLAPQLIYYGKIGVLEGDPSYGHLRMVVMEYIEGETLDNVTQISPRVIGEIRHALDLLHRQGYVFGDLRRPNVMITDNGEVKLIDFDWAGFHGKSQYPLLISPNLAWPKGVEGLSIMEAWHDDDMLTRLLPEQ
jgi:serine/threonine protein kinase